MKILFDTYAWIEYFLGSAQGKIAESYLKEEVITPIIVLLELSYRADKENWKFKTYLDFIKLHSTITNINEEFILEFGSFYNKIKNRIPKIGLAEIIILMTSIREDSKILTGDIHFKGFPNIIFLDLNKE